MAFRLVSANSPVRSLFKAIPKVSSENVGSIRHFKCNCDPSVPFLEKPSCVFSKSALLHHWGCLPVVIISSFGFAMEMIFLVRQAITRDDVWFTKDSGACDKIETRKGYTGAIRKMCVVNQKYATPPYLLEALQGSPDGPKPMESEAGSSELECAPKMNVSALIAHAVVSITAISLAML